MYNKFIEKIVTNPKFYNFLGFTIVRNTMDEAAITQLRDAMEEAFKTLSIDDRVLNPSDVLKFPEIYRAAFNKKIINCLKSTLGEKYITIPDYQVQRNSFGTWHVDSGSENLASYLYSKKYAFAKCGIFFQHNSKYGGSIQIRWFSHFAMYNRLPFVFRKIIQKTYVLCKKLLTHTVKLNPGDFITFDSRLEHASVLPSGVKLDEINNGYYPLDFDDSKYTLYWNACNIHSVDGFMLNSMRRSFFEEYIKSPEKGRVYFSDYLSRYFPNDFPEEYIENAAEYNLHIASLDKEDASKLKWQLEKVKQNLKEDCVASD